MISEKLQNFITEDFNLGKKIAFYRNLKGMSQEELAKKIGKTRGTISAYENNVADLTVPILFQIAKILDVNLYDFVYDIDQHSDSVAEPGITYQKDLEREVKLLREELDILKRELKDKDKIIALYEAGKLGEQSREASLEAKITQLEELVNKLISKISP